ncbi:MAG: hypothetical protein K6U11_14355, partial [bacterium]|nr:hypothetical protein [bacterium]
MKKKRAVLILIILVNIGCILGWPFECGFAGEADQPLFLTGDGLCGQDFNQSPSSWELPFQYAQTSWPSIHRDGRNSNYLP